jgi:hypothetical protein
MKKISLFSILLTSIICLVSEKIFSFDNFTHAYQDHILKLQHIKDQNGALKHEFLQELKDIFRIDIFIETGTYLGDTTNNARNYFKEVHTIELAPHLYNKAKDRFQTYKNVYVHLGDSIDLLPEILSTVTGKILFWLDGHYSESNDAKGKTNTPIMQELEVIKNSNIKNAVILIDDMRCFQTFENTPENSSLMGYPTVNEVFNMILTINKDYQCAIIGDTAIAFLKQEPVSLSPVIKACTKSRLCEDDSNFENLLDAESIIASSQGEERASIQQLHSLFSHSEKRHKTGKHYRLWYGLTLLNDHRYNEAQNQLLKSVELGLDAKHIDFYLNEVRKRKIK